MNFEHKFTNDIDVMASAFQIKPHILKKWGRTKAAQAYLFDLAYSAIKKEPVIYQAILGRIDIENYAEVTVELGLPSSINGLTWSPIPIISLRAWLKNTPVTFNGALIGLQQMKIAELTELAGQNAVNKARNKAGLQDRDLVSLFLANEKALVALIGKL